jgi:KDO2-lipid IV(A) lauroyltransferase
VYVDTVKFQIFKLALAITNALPLATVHWLGQIIGKASWLKNGRLRRIATANIRLCFPELDSPQQTELVKKTLRETGKAILEAGKMWYDKGDDVLSLVRSSDNEQLIKEAQQQGRGVILAIPHCGCWEIVGLYCARHYAMTTMYAAMGRPQFDQLLLKGRQRTGATLAPTDGSGIRAMRKALQRQELVGMLPDQSPTRHGEFADFMGHPCYTMTLLPKLARSTNAVVIFACARRLADSSGFQLMFRQASQDIAQLELTAALQTMNRDIAAMIRQAPQQYQWTYKRFRKQPEGAPPVY